jgi:DNA-directed RNA polymerase subunit RPC12/RpoP
MINCPACGKKLFSMLDVLNTKTVGFALFGDCRHCKGKIPVDGLWRRTKREKWVELPPEKKRKNKQDLSTIDLPA